MMSIATISSGHFFMPRTFSRNETLSDPICEDYPKQDKDTKEDVSFILNQLETQASLDFLMEEKKLYIAARNNIIDNPLKYLFYKKKLREIDYKLDQIDMDIYEYESSHIPSANELESIVLQTTSEVDEYLRHKTK